MEFRGNLGAARLRWSSPSVSPADRSRREPVVGGLDLGPREVARKVSLRFRSRRRCWAGLLIAGQSDGPTAAKVRDDRLELVPGGDVLPLGKPTALPNLIVRKPNVDDLSECAFPGVVTREDVKDRGMRLCVPIAPGTAPVSNECTW